MSNTFKYLNDENKQQSSDDAAQTFLNEKLSKNKFMAKDDPYSMGEGTTPDGTAYPGSNASIAAASSDTSSSSSSDSNSMKGSRTPEEVRQEFGLKYDEATAAKMDNKKLGMNKKGTKTRLQTDDGHFWYQDANGQQKYLGQAVNYDRGSVGYGGTDRKGSDISDYHAGDDKRKGGHHLSSNKILQQAHDINNGPGHNNGFNSVNDLGGAFRSLINTEAPKAVAPVEKATPIEHSPEIEQAKERVQTYENDVLSGKTSEDIYGSGSDYSFDASKGAAGIGTPMSGDSNQQAGKATASFLDKKVFDVKSKHQFQPTS